MTEQEQKDKVKEYSERHQQWSNQALTQFGYSTNLFTTIGIGFLAYLINERKKFPAITIDFEQSVNWSLLLFVISVCLTLLTVVFGLISITSRLYDIRITRHLVLTRKRVMKKHAMYLTDKHTDISNQSKIGNFFRSLNKIDFVTGNDISNIQTVNTKFESLRMQSKLLGELAWTSHKLQLVLLLLSVIIYSTLIF
ncbi:hypothetical protein [Ekhidna sp.]